MIKDANGKFNDYFISPKIRQTCDKLDKLAICERSI